MPSIPIPQQVPIQRAGWNTDLSGNVQMPNNERTPVNPIMSGLTQAGMQAQQALQGAQAVNTVTDVQQKQRQMQLSMLNGLANLPPDQYAKLAPNVIAIANRYNPSYQIKPDLDQSSAKMLMMSNVPTEQMPMFNLMMGQSDLVNNLTNGGAGSGIIPNVTNVMPTGGGGFAAVNVPIGQPSGAAPIPGAEGGAQPIQGTGDLGAPSLPALPTDSLMTNPGLAVMKPQSVTAAADVKKTQYESPQGKGLTEYNTKNASQITENNKQIEDYTDMLIGLKKAVMPDPDLGGLSPAAVGTGNFAPETRGKIGMAFPSLGGLVGASPQSSLGYKKLATLLPQISAEDAKDVKGAELKQLVDEVLTADPSQRPQVIAQTMDVLQQKINRINEQNRLLAGRVGVPTPQNAVTQLPSNMQPNKGSGKGSPAPDGTIITNAQGIKMQKVRGQWSIVR